MKKLVHVLFVLLSYLLLAQSPLVAPNAGFETWGSDIGSEPDPTDWITVNLARNQFVNENNPISAFQETVDVVEGTITLKIVTVNLLTNPYPEYIPWTGGIAILGVLQLNPDIKVIPGFTVTNFAPTAFSYTGKYIPSNTDSAFAHAYLTHYNTTTKKKDTIAYAIDTMKALVANYELRTVDFVYLPEFVGISADTCMVNFSSSCFSGPQLGSALYIDDIEFAFPSGVSAPLASDGFMVYPNPTQDKLFIGGTNRNASSVTIFRADGTLLKSKTLSAESFVETSGMAPGIYTMQILNAEGKVISTKKFSVNK